MSIKITTILENNSDLENKFLCEHGLSLLIETDTRNILFDTGQSDIFLENANRMNIDINKINNVILSHGHYDHTGGIIPFLNKKNNVKDIYVGEGFFAPKYKYMDGKNYKYNGIPFKTQELSSKVTIVNEDIKYINNELIIFHNFNAKNSFEKINKGFFIKENGEYVQDCFIDEIALGIKSKNGLILIAGCSHIGIINIIDTVKSRIDIPICGLIGGTHLVDCNEERLDKTIEELKKLDLNFIAVSHCTGDNNIERLKKEFGNKFIFNITGNIIIC